MDKINNKEFKIKDIVWAKAKGNPWWPGIIKNISFYNIEKDNEIIKEKIYKIYFIGEKSYVTLTKEYIQLFIENYKEHLSTKNQSLIKSIRLAKDIYNKRKNHNIIHFDKNINKNITEIKDYRNKEKVNFTDKKKKKENYNSNHDEYGRDLESEDEIKYKDYIENDNKKKIKKNNNLIQYNEKKLLFKDKNKNDNNIKINININLTNNNNSTFNIFGIPQINQINNNINQNINNDHLKLLNNKRNINFEENDCGKRELIKSSIFLNKEELRQNTMLNNNYNEDNNEEKNIFEKINNNCEKMKEVKIIEEAISDLYKKIINYELDLSNPDNQSKILEGLDNLLNILKNNLSKDEIQIDYLKNKYIISKLLNLTFHNDNNIKEKSSSILSILKEYIINNLFLFNEVEKDIIKNEINILNNNNQCIIEDINNDDNLGDEICQLIDKEISNFDLLNQKQKNIYYEESPNDYNQNELINDNENENEELEETINDLNYKINEEFYNILNGMKKEEKKEEEDYEFNNISESFYKTIYNKENNGLDFNSSLKRKKICINLLYLIRKILPKSNISFIKKMIIYYEYKIRKEDPVLGKKYYIMINNLFNKIKFLL